MHDFPSVAFQVTVLAKFVGLMLIRTGTGGNLFSNQQYQQFNANGMAALAVLEIVDSYDLLRTRVLECRLSSVEFLFLSLSCPI